MTRTGSGRSALRGRTAIADVTAWEVLDSRGRPTVACRIVVAGGGTGIVRVPSGASAGIHEAVELRDGGERYQGNGVRTAVAGVNDLLGPAVVGGDARDLDAVDAILAAHHAAEPTRIGANSTLAVSLATLLAVADEDGLGVARSLSGVGPLELPVPMVNIISGGAHAGGVIDLQDFLVVPHGATTFAEAICWAQAVREQATRIAKQRGHRDAVLVADEGGLGIALESNRAALELVVAAIEAAGLTPGTQASLAIDAAASQFLTVDPEGQRPGSYHLAAEQRTLSGSELIDEYASWLSDYPIVSIEDALAEDDWEGWAELTSRLGTDTDLIGDDLFVTQADRLVRGIQTRCGTAILIKVNQNGLVSRTRDVVTIAKAAGFRTVVSARSGETEDVWVADLAVGWRAGQIKVGSTHRSERTAKWNRLLELEALEQTVLARPWDS